MDPFDGADPVVPAVWWCDPTDSAVVLGSRQADGIVDIERCQRAGLSVVRRRSGGGAVLIIAGAVGWIDLVLPHGIAPDDVRGSMIWAGELIAEAAGLAGEVRVHRSAMVETPWSPWVCFAGLGPGEVVVNGLKSIGLSQRRTRRGVRIQAMWYRRAVADEVVTYLTSGHPSERLPEIGVAAMVDPRSLASAVADLVSRS